MYFERVLSSLKTEPYESAISFVDVCRVAAEKSTGLWAKHLNLKLIQF